MNNNEFDKFAQYMYVCIQFITFIKIRLLSKKNNAFSFVTEIMATLGIYIYKLSIKYTL